MSRLSTIEVNSLLRKQASRGSRVFLIMYLLVQSLVGLFLVMVQQQLTNLHTSFQQQIAALSEALGTSTNSKNSATLSVLSVYLENVVTSSLS